MKRLRESVNSLRDATKSGVSQGHENPQTPRTRPRTALPLAKLFDGASIDVLMEAIDQLHISKSNSASTSTPNTHRKELHYSIDKAAEFLESFDAHTKEIKDEGNFFQSGQGHKVVEEILKQLGQLHWIAGGLSIIAYLMDKFGTASENRSDCLDLLKRMFYLVRHIKKFKYEMLKDEMSEVEQQKLRDAFEFIMEGCMTCASLLKSGGFFGFLKSSVNYKTLKNLSSKISTLYPDLTMDVLMKIKEGQPSYRPVILPKFLEGAVGLKQPLEELQTKLHLQETEARVVVIHGLGGIGKTTLADALVATVAEDIKDYNYTKVEINNHSLNKDLKTMQEQILLDCFPTYQSGRPILLRGCDDGRNNIIEAINSVSEKPKPVFIFIDNALRLADLEDLFPEDLRGLPKRSRILITTSYLPEIDLFHRIPRHDYAVRHLSQDDALQILCNDPTHCDEIRDNVQEILDIGNGIPLILKILGARLRRQEYKVENCFQFFKDLKDGKDVKEQDLSGRLFHYVYEELEYSTQEAFLDICYFFNGWSRRLVEYIVGVEEVTSLVKAAFVTSLPFINSLADIRLKGIYLAGEDKLIVNDIIKAKGINMAKQTRIMDFDSWCDTPQDKVIDIKGLELSGRKDRLTIEEKRLNLTRKFLRILNLGGGICFSACSSREFKELRCIKLHTDINCLPMNLEGLPCFSFYVGPIYEEHLSKLPQNLKYLKPQLKSYSDVDESQAVRKSFLELVHLSEEDMPADVDEIQAVGNSSLEVLDLSKEDTPEMLQCSLHKLKILLLEGWDQMEELPSQVCGLTSLNKLILRECLSLKRLPESIANLRALTHLDLSSCFSLKEVSSSLEELTALSYLDLTGCVKLQKLPDNIGLLSALEYLSLRHCERLEELPGTFALLRSLKELNLSCCDGLKELPSNFLQLPTLEVLWMVGVSKLLTRLGPTPDNWKIIGFKSSAMRVLSPFAGVGKGKGKGKIF